MTHVSTPNVGGLPRQRSWSPGSIGAIALVIAVGAVIAGGIAFTTDEAPATPVVPHISTELLERQARSGPALSAQAASEEALREAVRQGQVPAQALTNTDDRATESQIEEAARRSHVATKASPSSLPFVE